MKLNKIILAAFAIAALVTTACDPIPQEPDGPTKPGSKDTTQVTPSDPTAPTADTITIARALEILGGMEAKAETEEAYYILGEVSYVLTAADALANYGNCNFKIIDESDKTGFSCFYMNYLNNEKFTDASQIPVVGDKVTVYGKLKNYAKDDKITPEMTNGYIAAIEKTGSNPTLPEVGNIDYNADEMSVSDALTSALVTSLASGATSTDSLTVRGQVSRISDIDTGTYGNATYYISDGKKEFYIYRSYGLNNQKFTNADQLKVGDIVTVKGLVQNYNGTIEVVKGHIVRTTNTTEYTTTGGGEPNPGDGNASVEAGDVLIDASVDKGVTTTSNVGPDSFTKDGVTIAISSGCLNLIDQYRVYKNQTLTISAEKAIAKIQLECTAIGEAQYGPGCFTATPGTYTYEGKVGTWEGNATSVTFTASTNQVRINKIHVTYAE